MGRACPVIWEVSMFHRFVSVLAVSTIASQAALAACSYAGSPAVYVNCINSELQALQAEVAVLQTEHAALEADHAALKVDHDALVLDHADLQAELTNYATIGELDQCLTADDVDLEFAAQQGLLSGNFYGLSAVGADFEDANVSGFDLRGDFSYAQFRQADLRGADLYGATLVGTSFFYADLTGATLNYADLTEANLTGANLTGVSVSGSPIMTDVVWNDTTCRDGTNSDDHGGTCCGHMYWAGVGCD